MRSERDPERTGREKAVCFNESLPCPQGFCQGSLTVEATCLMGIILWVVTIVLFLFFHVHSRAYLTCAAYESALCGSLAGQVEGEMQALNEAGIRSEILCWGRVFGAREVTPSVNLAPTLTGLDVAVGYEGLTQPLFGMAPWSIEVEAKVGILYPVKWIRNAKAVRDLLFQK